ncbi:MAG TPA: DNRLRE domain-containing protein [Kofleriaceae bacterium]|nr:DNRLRE domain-containing protein [Kofleriaceae bacterium]
MRRVVFVVSVTACGRSGFGIEVDAASGSGNPDSAIVTDGDGSVVDPFDAPMGSVVTKFGETPTSNVMGVTSDTYLNGEAGSVGNNYGGSTSIQVEGSQDRALVKFTLTAIPAGKTILAARLHLYSQSSQAGSAALYPVLEDWTEGTGTGGVAGVANWSMRTATLSWTSAGAGTPGSSGAQIATFTTPGTGAFGVDLPVATVQAWINTPSTNFGLMISATGAADLSFASSNNATTTNRPELVVTYAP